MKTVGQEPAKREASVSREEEIAVLRRELAALGLTIPNGLEGQWADAWMRIQGLTRRVRQRAGREGGEPAHLFSVDRTSRP